MQLFMQLNCRTSNSGAAILKLSIILVLSAAVIGGILYHNRVEVWEAYHRYREDRSDFPSRLFVSGSNKISSAENKSGLSELHRVILINGDQLIGQVVTEPLKVTTEYSRFNFKVNDVNVIEFVPVANTESEMSERITTVNGDRITGKLEFDRLRIKLRDGQTVSVDKDQIKVVRIRQ